MNRKLLKIDVRPLKSHTLMMSLYLSGLSMEGEKALRIH